MSLFKNFISPYVLLNQYKNLLLIKCDLIFLCGINHIKYGNLTP